MIETRARLIDEAPESGSDTASTSGPTRSVSVRIDGKLIIPMVSGDRPQGLYAVDGDGVEWFPVVTARRRVGLTAAAAGLAVLVTVAILNRARRCRPAIALIDACTHVERAAIRGAPVAR